MNMQRRFKTGDKVVCKIRGNSIVMAREEIHDAQLPFEIIGFDANGVKYIVVVPKYYSVKNSWTITEDHLDKYDISPNYLDEKGIAIFEDKIFRAESHLTCDGMFCNKCNEFVPMAEPNQSNGTLVCYMCRTNPWR